MAYVIAEPCIGVKDMACVDACPVDCIHPKRTKQPSRARLSSTSIRSNVSTAAPACQCVRCRRSLHWMTCLRSGRPLQK